MNDIRYKLKSGRKINHEKKNQEKNYSDEVPNLTAQSPNEAYRLILIEQLLEAAALVRTRKLLGPIYSRFTNHYHFSRGKKISGHDNLSQLFLSTMTKLISSWRPCQLKLIRQES
jgi:hypothetical protein